MRFAVDAAVQIVLASNSTASRGIDVTEELEVSNCLRYVCNFALCVRVARTEQNCLTAVCLKIFVTAVTITKNAPITFHLHL